MRTSSELTDTTLADLGELPVGQCSEIRLKTGRLDDAPITILFILPAEENVLSHRFVGDPC